jgi:hypothetical protein
MTDAQFYNVMLLTTASQVLAILFCWAASFAQQLRKDLRELCMLLWLVTSSFLPYLDTGINGIFRVIMFMCLIVAAGIFAKYFWGPLRKRAFYIQLFISYIAAIGYLFAYWERVN